MRALLALLVVAIAGAIALTVAITFLSFIGAIVFGLLQGILSS